MNANPVLLQKKYARIVGEFAAKTNITLKEALDIFYHSDLYVLMSEGVSDMHCMSDGYLVQELEIEQAEKKNRENNTIDYWRCSDDPESAGYIPCGSKPYCIHYVWSRQGKSGKGQMANIRGSAYPCICSGRLCRSSCRNEDLSSQDKAQEICGRGSSDTGTADCFCCAADAKDKLIVPKQ